MTTSEPRTFERPAAFFAFALLISILVIVFATGDFLSNTKDIAPEVALYLKCVELIQQGQKPYIDFFDSSPPILYVLFSLPLKLSTSTGFDLAKTFGCFVGLLAICSAAFGAFLLRQGLKTIDAEIDNYSKKEAGAVESGKDVLGDLEEQPQPRDENRIKALVDLKRQIQDAYAPLLIGFAVFNFWIGFEWGQTQHLFSLLYFPFLLVRWMRWQGCGCHRFVGFVSGVLATVGLCLDLTNFWIVMIGVEACFFLEYRQFKPFWTPEIAGAVSTFICSNAYILSLSPDVRDAYLEWVKPFSSGFKSVISFDKATFGVDSAPDRRDIIYVLAVSVCLALGLANRNSLLMPLSAVALAGFGLYALEGEGFSYQFIVGQFGTALAASIEGVYLLQFAGKIIPMKSKRSKLGFATMAVFAGLLSFMCWMRMQMLRADMEKSITQQRMKSPHIRDVETVIEEETKPGDPVLVLSDAARPGFPALFFKDRKPGGYLLWGRPIRVLGWCSIKGLCQGSYEKYYNHVYHDKVPKEIESHYPALVLVDKAGAYNELTPLGTIRLLDEHYERLGDTHYYTNGKEPREVSGRNWDFLTYKRKPKEP